MDTLRRERIARQFNGRIQVSEVSAVRVLEIRSILEARLSLRDSRGVALAKALRSRARLAADVTVESDPSAIERVLTETAGGREGTVLLNWGQWTDLDSVTINAFIEAFWDFWYPKADDLDILSVTFEWIVSIDYDGWIYVAHL